MVTYRFIISGSTAERSFVVKDGATARVSGLVISKSDGYAKSYVQGWLAYAVKAGLCKGIRVKQWFTVPRAGFRGCAARERV
jgi:hypothetical protein